MNRELDTRELARLEEELVEIVGRAAKLIKDAPFAVDEKDGPANIVTSSDLKCQQFLYGELASLVEGAGFLGEEEDLRDVNHEYVWVIDPIDGTANYSRAIADCGISVALVYKGRSVLGAVHAIFTDDVYSAHRGGGARLNGKPIKVSARNFSAGILCTAMSVYNKNYARACNDVIYLDADMLEEEGMTCPNCGTELEFDFDGCDCDCDCDCCADETEE